jgi:DNA-binding NtrC family response regulator
VRELDHVIERAVLMAQGPQIKNQRPGLTSGGATARGSRYDLEEVEAFLIKKALARQTECAGGSGRRLG